MLYWEFKWRQDRQRLTRAACQNDNPPMCLCLHQPECPRNLSIDLGIRVSWANSQSGDLHKITKLLWINFSHLWTRAQHSPPSHCDYRADFSNRCLCVDKPSTHRKSDHNTHICALSAGPVTSKVYYPCGHPGPHTNKGTIVSLKLCYWLFLKT